MANLPYVTGNESKVLGIMKMYSKKQQISMSIIILL